MSHVYRPTYTTKIPKAATHCTHRGKPAVRWKGRGGRVVTGIVCEGNAGKCLVEAQKWYVAHRDAQGNEVFTPGFADKAATEALRLKLDQQAARIASGMLPPEAAVVRRSLPELLDRWRDYLAASGDTPKHAKTQRLRAARVVTAAGATRPADLTPAAVVRGVAKVKAELGISARTAGHHLGAVKAFTRWLVTKERYEPTDPLSGLSREDDDTDPRLVRRTLSIDQFAHLIATTRASKIAHYGLTGPERAALYLAAASTGLRASELASLTTSSFDLAAATVTVKAAYAKGRRLDELPLPADVVPALRTMMAGRKPTAPAWPDRTGNAWHVWYNMGAEMVARDLAAAGIPKADAAGRVYDFHALRSQFATDLERAGVSLGRAQKLMRHSTPLLTAKHYTRPEKDELAADVNKLRRG